MAWPAGAGATDTKSSSGTKEEGAGKGGAGSNDGPRNPHNAYDYKGEKVCWGDNGDIGAKARGRGRESSPLAARDQPPPLVHRMPAHPRRAALCALHPRGPGS